VTWFSRVERRLFDLDLLDDEDPFEIDEQLAHLFKHLAAPDSGEPSRCRPIGCYGAARQLADQYGEDRAVEGR
jgi:hypothetical protein